MFKNKAMKFGCIGCGVVILIFAAVIIGGIGLIGYQGYRFGKEIGDTYKSMTEGYQHLDQAHPFTPPADGIMTRERLDTYLTIRSQITLFAKDYFDKIEKQGESIGKQFEEPGFWAKIHGISKIREIVQIAVKLGAAIGQEHVRLLTEQTMSMKEYHWYTLTYLGTLSKSEENSFTEGVQLWEKYLVQFDSARRNHKDFNMNFGNHQMNGQDMNRENLMEKLKPIAFAKPNAELIVATQDRLFPDPNVPTLDFLTLYYEEILNNLSSGAKSPNHKPVSIHPK